MNFPFLTQQATTMQRFEEPTLQRETSQEPVRTFLAELK